MEKRQTNRIQWIDAAKCIGMVMVAFGHNWLDSKFCYYFYAFHMPLFFILAGITFSTKRDFMAFTWRKFKTLMIPYIFFAFCLLVFYDFLSLTHGGNYDIYENAKAFVLQQRHTLLWFLPVMFLSELLVFILLKIRGISRGTGILIVIIGLIVVHILLDYLEYKRLIWNIDLVPIATAFILVGVLYQRFNGRLLIENKFWFIGTLLLMSIFVTTYNYISSGQFVDMFNSQYGHYPLFLIGAISATYFLILVLKKITMPQWLIYIGTYSLVYYGFHRILIELMFIAYGRLGLEFVKDAWSGVGLAILNVLVSFALIYPISIFINKRCPWLIGKF